MKESFKEKIKVKREEQGYLWNAMLVSGGGSAYILLTIHNILGVMLGLLGLFFCICFTANFFDGRIKLLKNIDRLDGDL